MGAPSYSTVHLLYTHKKQKSSRYCHKNKQMFAKFEEKCRKRADEQGKRANCQAVQRQSPVLLGVSISSFALLICGGCLSAPHSGALVQDKQPPKCLFKFFSGVVKSVTVKSTATLFLFAVYQFKYFLLFFNGQQTKFINQYLFVLC